MTASGRSETSRTKPTQHLGTPTTTDSDRPRAAVELLGKLSFNVLAQGREAGLPAERPSGAVG